MSMRIAIVRFAQPSQDLPRKLFPWLQFVQSAARKDFGSEVRRHKLVRLVGGRGTHCIEVVGHMREFVVGSCYSLLMAGVLLLV